MSSGVTRHLFSRFTLNVTTSIGTPSIFEYACLTNVLECIHMVSNVSLCGSLISELYHDCISEYPQSPTQHQTTLAQSCAVRTMQRATLLDPVLLTHIAEQCLIQRRLVIMAYHPSPSYLR